MKYLTLISLSLFVIISGCTTVNQTIYLQDIKVSGPIDNPPLNITTDQKKGSFTFSSRFSINDNKSLSGRIEKHTDVNYDGIYRVDTLFNNDGTRSYRESSGNVNEYNGKNLEWDIPNFLAAFDMDYAVGNNFALNVGLNYSVQNQDDFLGGCAGLGFFSENEGTALRFDVGVMWQSLSYVASTVVITTVKPFSGSPTTTVDFFKDRNKSTNWNPYAFLTFNTSSQNTPLNFFLNIGLFGQTLFDFEPSDPNPEYYPFGVTVIRNDQRGESTTTFLTLGTGVFLNLTERSKIIAGVRFMKETQIEETSKSLFILPVLQVDIGF